jgi:CBS domain-containing protein
VADAMLRDPKVLGPATTIAQARAFFADGHVHAALIVERGRLLAVVEPLDLVGDLAADGPAVAVGRLRGRVAAPGADLAAAWDAMALAARRRLAVVDERGDLLGLLCLKRSGTGFCSEDDVRARAEDSQRSDDRYTPVRWR